MGHEFGHFLIAKVNGIRVNEFAIGMGPKIAGFKKGETEYVLRAFPLGGACIFEGEDGLEAAKEEASAAGTPADKTGRGALQNVPVDVDRGNFQNAPVWSRIATVFAGPLFNFLLAFIFAIMVAGYAGADLPVRQWPAPSRRSSRPAIRTVRPPPCTPSRRSHSCPGVPRAIERSAPRTADAPGDPRPWLARRGLESVVSG